MPVGFSIKRVPGGCARAQRNHRSLQGEVRAVIEAAASETRRTGECGARAGALRIPLDISYSTPPRRNRVEIREERDGRRLTVEDLFDHVSGLGTGTPDESTTWIRQLRSSR